MRRLLLITNRAIIWRVCFRWNNGDAYDVEITDYHYRKIMSRTKQKRFAPVHPGEILLEEFLNPLSINRYRLAKDIGVPTRRINEIIQGKRGISANTALRLGAYFSTSAEFWMNLQSRYDLEIEKDLTGDDILRTIKASSPAA